MWHFYFEKKGLVTNCTKKLLGKTTKINAGATPKLASYVFLSKEKAKKQMNIEGDTSFSRLFIELFA